MIVRGIFRLGAALQYEYGEERSIDRGHRINGWRRGSARVSRRFEIFWEPIRDDSQNDVAFEQRLDCGQDHRKGSHGAERTGDDLVRVAAVDSLCDLDEGCAIDTRSEAPLDRRAVVIVPTFPQSMRIRRSFTTSTTRTPADALYISQSHRTSAPGTSLPLLLVNQNLLVMSGSTKASKTSLAGLRISIAAVTTGSVLICRLSRDIALSTSFRLVLSSSRDIGCQRPGDAQQRH